MPASYRLRILTPAGPVFEDEIEHLQLEGVEGKFGILAKHAPLIASIEPGPVKVERGEQTEWFAVSGGVLEIGGGEGCLVLADAAEEVESSDAGDERVAELLARRDA